MKSRAVSYLLLAVCGAGLLHSQAARKTRPRTAPAGPDTAGQIERMIADSPVASAAAWGIDAVEVASGRTVYEMNAGHLFVPASNTKLFTTSLALKRLGPDYTFTTRVLSASAPDAAGVIDGDVRLVGGGDPNLSGRVIPYTPKASSGDPLIALTDLANQVAASGVKRITGDIVGDDRYYVWEPYGAGWGMGDPLYDYGAAISALTINDNAFVLRVTPGNAVGELALLELRPAVEFYKIDNRVRTVAGTERHIHYSRAPGSATLELWGDIGVDNSGQDLALGIDDPARYAAIAFRDMLTARGITVIGGALASHLYPYDAASARKGSGGSADWGVALAQRTSAPLIEDLRITAKVSQNEHAELDLRAVGKARRNIGSVDAGLDELRIFLSEAGVPASGYNINDGSGLARLNLVSPAAMVKLLRYMYNSPLRDNFLSILPVAGQDGTLGTRFAGSPAAGRIHAKTGSLTHVSALSGYAQRTKGDWIAFSILVNNYSGSSAEIHGIMDKICEMLAQGLRP